MLESTTDSRDDRLEGLGTFIRRPDTRVRRLGTSGILLDRRLDQNFTSCQTGLGLGWTERLQNGGIRLADWGRGLGFGW